MCGKIEKLLDQNKIWCGTRYELKLNELKKVKKKSKKSKK